VSVIVTIVGGIATIYYLRLSATREAVRIREQERAKAIESAERPLKAEIAAHLASIERLRQEHAAALSAQREQHREQVTAVRDSCTQQLATANRTIDSLVATVSTRDARIDVLEDELRRGWGHGDNDAARQPPTG
jgi:chromosome segregation ATPase